MEEHFSPWDREMISAVEASEKVATEATDIDVLAFQGFKDPLSNFFPCTLTDNSRTFSSAEQMYQYTKAIYHRDYTSARLILNVKRAYDCKKVSKRVRVSDAWLNERVDILKDIAEKKYLQVPEVRSILARHTNSYIAEAVPGECFWSCGYDKWKARRINPKLYPGRNEMGRIWMCIRDKYMTSN